VTVMAIEETPETVVEHVEDQVSKTWVQKSLRYVLYAYLLGLVVFCIWQHKVLFGGWDGIVVGNLIASAIWAPLALIHVERLQIKHHKERLAQDRKHHLELVKLHKLHHEDLKKHVADLLDDQAS
jgi:hypothetical protein